MMKSYYYTSKFIDGYAFVRDPNSGEQGLINSDGIEIIPVEYTYFIGSIYDQFMIGYKLEKELVPTPVDYDIDNFSYNYIYKESFYLIDKDGHKFYLNFHPESKVTYCGKNNYDGSIKFYEEYEYKEHPYACYRKNFYYYNIYPGDNFVIIEKVGEKTYIQYFDGTKEKIDNKQLEEIRNKIKTRKL